MITSPRSLLRASADMRLQAHVLAFLNNAPRSRWWTLAEVEPHVPVNMEQLLRLFNAWTEAGWLDYRKDAGRSMWQPTTQMPIVSVDVMDERTLWSRMFSGILGLPVR